MTSSQRILPLTIANMKAGTALYCMVSICTGVCIQLDDTCDSFSQEARGMLGWCGLVPGGPGLFESVEVTCVDCVRVTSDGWKCKLVSPFQKAACPIYQES